MISLPLPSLRPTPATGICILCLLSTTGIAAEPPQPNCDGLSGTYLTTTTDREGVFASRSLLTFTADGALLTTDSRHSGTSERFKPVSASQGSWHCVASTHEGMKIEAITVNFALADQDGLQTLERIDYELKLNDAGAGLTGTARLMVAISSDLEGAEPISEPGELIETFSIKGAKISTVATSSIVQP